MLKCYQNAQAIAGLFANMDHQINIRYGYIINIISRNSVITCTEEHLNEINRRKTIEKIDKMKVKPFGFTFIFLYSSIIEIKIIRKKVRKNAEQIFVAFLWDGQRIIL